MSNATDLRAEVESPDAAELAELDSALVLHPHRPHDHDQPTIMAGGERCTVTDVDGNEYLDATAGLAVTQIGHGRQEIAAAAAAQMRQLEYYPAFWDYSNPTAIRLAERLVALAPGPRRKVFFTSGGSEGIEAAARMARFFHSSAGETRRTVILARRSAYHGVGYGSGSLTGMGDYHRGFEPMLPDVVHLTPPWACHTELFGGEDPTEFCARELEATIAEVGADRLAAFVAEPVMGVAGMVTPAPGYWPRIAQILAEHGILLIMDEVISAYGRTGHWFASERFEVVPDIIVTAKGLTSGYFPLGAVLLEERIAERLDRGEDGFPIGYTYSGHPTGCAVALANLDVIEREGLLERSRTSGRLIVEALEERVGASEALVEIRGEGLMIGVELSRETAAGEAVAAEVSRLARERHAVLVRPHANSLSITPPLVIEEHEALRIVDAVAAGIDQLGNGREAG